jgi:hypothetical protein
MARVHITLPDGLMERVREYCKKEGLVTGPFIGKVLEAAISGQGVPSRTWVLPKVTESVATVPEGHPGYQPLAFPPAPDANTVLTHGLRVVDADQDLGAADTTPRIVRAGVGPIDYKKINLNALKDIDAAGHPTPPAENFDVVTLEHNGIWWYEAEAVAKVLNLDMPQLWAEIDYEDDVLHHAGVDWLDMMGVNEACTMCADLDLADRFRSWAKTKGS